MKTLLILRHAKSSCKDESIPDHDRPLAKRGKQDAPSMGELLPKEGLLPDLILSSSAKRARATAELAAEAAGYGGEIIRSRDLYAFEPGPYMKALRELPDEVDRVMIVGHNPGLQELLEALTGESELLPTAALAEVELPVKRWREISGDTPGKLINLWSEALSVVVITKLPFDVPTDPLIAARSELYEDSFNEYYLPEAILKFRQGFGRLIRHRIRSRCGCDILDRRVLTKQYGRLFLESLPQCTARQGPLANLSKMAAQWLGT